jgi:hypothetical protein
MLQHLAPVCSFTTYTAVTLVQQMPRLRDAPLDHPSKEWSSMPKPLPDSTPDPMAGVVDRLLAQLPGLQNEPATAGVRPRAARQWSTPVVAARQEPTTLSQVVGVWGRVLLGLSLGLMMANWPYPKACGSPLAGYFTAVLTVTLAGMWAATAAWKRRMALAHVVSLIIVLYGFLLGGAEVLPRNGYSVDRATWECPDPLG